MGKTKFLDDSGKLMTWLTSLSSLLMTLISRNTHSFYISTVGFEGRGRKKRRSSALKGRPLCLSPAFSPPYIHVHLQGPGEVDFNSF